MTDIAPCIIFLNPSLSRLIDHANSAADYWHDGSTKPSFKCLAVNDYLVVLTEAFCSAPNSAAVI